VLLCRLTPTLEFDWRFDMSHLAITTVHPTNYNDTSNGKHTPHSGFLHVHMSVLGGQATNGREKVGMVENCQTKLCETVHCVSSDRSQDGKSEMSQMSVEL
jgi:hypothetical protein